MPTPTVTITVAAYNALVALAVEAEITADAMGYDLPQDFLDAVDDLNRVMPHE